MAIETCKSRRGICSSGWSPAIILLAGLCLFLLKANPLASPPRETINWMGHWYKADRRYDLVLETAREFAFLNQNVELNLRFPEQIVQTNSKQLIARLIADMIRRNRIDWDIVWMDDHIYQFVAEDLKDPMWGQKYLVNFEEVPGFVQTQKQFIIKDPVYRNQTGGILVGPYIEGYYYAIYYNKIVAEKIGIKIKRYGMTFEDLLGYVKAVDRHNKTAISEIPAFYEAGDLPTMLILFQNLAKSLIGNFEEAKAEIDGPRKLEAMRKTFEAFQKMGKYGPLIPSYAQNQWFETRGLPLDDKVLFFISGTWMYNRWRDVSIDKTSKMVPAELPVFQPVNYCLGGVVPTWAVMKNSPNRAAAIKLLMFWCTPKIAEKWVRYTKTPTGIAGDVSKATLGNDVFEEFQRTMSQKYGNRVQYSYNAAYLLGSKNSLVLDDINKALWALLTGSITAEEANRRIIEKMR